MGNRNGASYKMSTQHHHPHEEPSSTTQGSGECERCGTHHVVISQRECTTTSATSPTSGRYYFHGEESAPHPPPLPNRPQISSATVEEPVRRHLHRLQSWTGSPSRPLSPSPFLPPPIPQRRSREGSRTASTSSQGSSSLSAAASVFHHTATADEPRQASLPRESPDTVTYVSLISPQQLSPPRARATSFPTKTTRSHSPEHVVSPQPQQRYSNKAVDYVQVDIPKTEALHQLKQDDGWYYNNVAQRSPNHEAMSRRPPEFPGVLSQPLQCLTLSPMRTMKPTSTSTITPSHKFAFLRRISGRSGASSAGGAPWNKWFSKNNNKS